MDARQFNGTFGAAKEIVSWSGMDETKIVCGASPDTPDEGPGGLDLVIAEDYVDQNDGMTKPGIRYITVEPTGWVVKNDSGMLVALNNQQFVALFPNFEG